MQFFSYFHVQKFSSHGTNNLMILETAQFKNLFSSAFSNTYKKLVKREIILTKMMTTKINFVSHFEKCAKSVLDKKRPKIKIF